jgi:hypothetical protein
MGKRHKVKFPGQASANLSKSRRKRPFRGFAGLGAMAQELIGEHAGNHGFADRNGADSNARIVAAFCRDLGLGAGTIDGEARGQNRGGGLDRETRDDRLASGDPAEYPARVVGWHTDVVDDGPQPTPGWRPRQNEADSRWWRGSAPW